MTEVQQTCLQLITSSEYAMSASHADRAVGHLSATLQPVVSNDRPLSDRAMYLPVQRQEQCAYQGNGLQHELLALRILQQVKSYRRFLA